jgi:guanylate kinase
MPPSVLELEMRLITRGKDSPERIKIRIEKAEAEMKLANQFDFVIVNRELDSALAEAVAIISSFLTN